jgi:nucleoside diphosphate kinase
MATNITLTMIKPDAVAAGHSGKIIDLNHSVWFQDTSDEAVTPV